ncbi:hypothetical protein [Dyella japonica]|uniref:hypothetical protein n=1 Tax=Dyella japonica TaxID=231455 RepID=UPI00118716D7|nr:hypothetical protein [Dyella japonica]
MKIIMLWRTGALYQQDGNHDLSCAISFAQTAEWTIASRPDGFAAPAGPGESNFAHAKACVSACDDLNTH